MTALTAAAPINLDQTRKVGMLRLIRVELRKVTDTRAGMWLLVAIGLITVAAVTIFLFAADANELTYENFAGVTLTPQGFLLPVLGILAVTSEWSQRTGLVTFTLEPSRSRIVVAKFVAVVALGLAAVAVALVAGALFNMLGSALMDGSGAWNLGMAGGRDFVLLQLMAIVQGLAFGMLLMNSAAAIVLYFVIPTAWSILFGIVSALDDAAPWLDLGTAQQPLFDDHSLTATQWSQILVTATIWIIVPFVAGTVRLLRVELKSA
ncbi:MAG TPA: ABC transporter permease [Nocardioidaceae bacterium]|nr:ABC transporter permease [Nocardioidaceae bacterium]